MAKFVAILSELALPCPLGFLDGGTLDVGHPALIRDALSTLMHTQLASAMAAGIAEDGNRRINISESWLPYQPMAWPNDILVAPAESSMAFSEALELLRQERALTGSALRQQPLKSLPSLAAAVDPLLTYVRHRLNTVDMHASIWMNDGQLATAVHYDDHDNLLIQLHGSKHVMLFSPAVHAQMGFSERAEHRFTIQHDRQSGRRVIDGSQPSGRSPESTTPRSPSSRRLLRMRHRCKHGW